MSGWYFWLTGIGGLMLVGLFCRSAKSHTQTNNRVLAAVCLIILGFGVYTLVPPKLPPAQKYYNSLDLELHALQFDLDRAGVEKVPEYSSEMQQAQSQTIYLLFDEKYPEWVISNGLRSGKIRADFLEELPDMIRWKLSQK